MSRWWCLAFVFPLWFSVILYRLSNSWYAGCRGCAMVAQMRTLHSIIPYYWQPWRNRLFHKDLASSIFENRNNWIFENSATFKSLHNVFQIFLVYFNHLGNMFIRQSPTRIFWYCVSRWSNRMSRKHVMLFPPWRNIWLLSIFKCCVLCRPPSLLPCW